MKVICCALFVCLVLADLYGQKKPEKKIEILPRGEHKFFKGDSLKLIPYGELRLKADSLKYFQDSIKIPKLKLFRRHSKMPEYIADPGIDYKIRIYKPDSTVDYKILRKR